jgi:tripartite-type tricarboxylate transporter receptor subunit TctC
LSAYGIASSTQSAENIMKLERRRFLRLAAGAAGVPILSRVAWGQAYPARPVHILVGFAPGGVTDILSRLIAQALSERLGQTFIVENRPGAASNIAAEAVARAPADGYTLLMATNVNAINAALYERLTFNFIRDLAPVANIASVPQAMVVNPAFPARTVREFVEYAKANPGKLSMATAGTGSALHVAGELFKFMAGVDMIHVPYRGEAPALTDLIANQVNVCFGTLGGSIEHIRAGKLRALAVTSAKRVEALPGIPTVGEFIPGYEVSAWDGLVAPKGTAAEIVNKLNGEVNAALADPKLNARLDELGLGAAPASNAEFSKFLADDVEKWAKVVKFAGIKAD